MALVVHESFPLNGKTISRGTVLFGNDAAAVKANRLLRKRCSAVPDTKFPHLHPDRKAQVVQTSPAPPPAAVAEIKLASADAKPAPAPAK